MLSESEKRQTEDKQKGIKSGKKSDSLFNGLKREYNYKKENKQRSVSETADQERQTAQKVGSGMSEKIEIKRASDPIRAVNPTLDYYTRNVESFFQDTADVPFSEIRNRFLSLLPEGGHILDLGCGSGRDAKAFLQYGYSVRAADGTPAMARAASLFLGQPVDVLLFEQLDEKNAYDGIWACASLLHEPKRALPDVIRRIERALKPGGIFYCSFKYGDDEGERNGRYFSDLTEASLTPLLQSSGLDIVELWQSEDCRKGRQDERWINALCKKKSADQDTQ